MAENETEKRTVELTLEDRANIMDALKYARAREARTAGARGNSDPRAEMHIRKANSIWATYEKIQYTR